jgi:hypothetical protein
MAVLFKFSNDVITPLCGGTQYLGLHAVGIECDIPKREMRPRVAIVEPPRIAQVQMARYGNSISIVDVSAGTVLSRLRYAASFVSVRIRPELTALTKAAWSCSV